MNDDPLALIDSLEPLRETVRGMVAIFVQDGFTEEQARELVVHFITHAGDQA
jgi:hypothetical protein